MKTPEVIALRGALERILDIISRYHDLTAADKEIVLAANQGLKRRRNVLGDKCPTCGTGFGTGMCPTQVARRKAEKTRRAR